MKYIVATTDNIYFRWQMLIQINNFKKYDLLDDLIYVVSVKNRRSKKLNLIEKETGVKIFTYKDERKNPKYTSSIRPHIMKKFLKEHPQYGKSIFYLDPDVTFTKKLEFKNPVITGSDVWFLSDTRSYIDSKYICSKGEDLLHMMCSVVDIDPYLVKSFDNYAGGAQYFMKNVDYDFWDKVENDCEQLYELMDSTENVFNPEHPIQKWTADMWAVLWNAWYFKHSTMIIDELNFCWATDNIKKWDNNNIYHNAGVFNENHLFNKIKFQNTSPFNENFSYVDENYCSFNYIKEIKDTKLNYPDLINKL